MKDDPSGFKYAGTVAKTLSGSACLPWTDTEAVQKAFLPDGMKPWGTNEGNKCRNRDDGYNTAGPWCYTNDKTAKKSDIEDRWCPVLLGFVSRTHVWQEVH